MANYNHNLIKIHRNYTYSELAGVFGIHKNTVAIWVKEGLPCLQDQRPFLILGINAKTFLQKKRASRKQVCKENELYCMRCKIPVRPAENFVEYSATSQTKGRITGFCEHCTGIINKFVSYSSLEAYSSIFALEKSIGLEHISDTDNPLLNSDFTK